MLVILLEFCVWVVWGGNLGVNVNLALFGAN